MQRLVALFVSPAVLALLLMALFIGKDLLAFVDVSIHAFCIAGGILLLLMGLKSVAVEQVGSSAQLVAAATGEGDLREAQSVFRKIVIAVALTLPVGPGVIADAG